MHGIRQVTGRHGARGFTAVEVLMAMTLFAIGAAGVITMQKVTIQGGEDARRFDMATSIANEWLARLQRDASYWTEPSSERPTTINLVLNTKWLGRIGPCGGVFCTPPDPGVPIPDGLSGAFDRFGRDLPAASTEARYCAQYRLTWIADPGVAPNLKVTGLMRVEVRVYWTKLESTPVNTCTQATAPPEILPAVSNFHTVYASSAIREQARR